MDVDKERVNQTTDYRDERNRKCCKKGWNIEDILYTFKVKIGKRRNFASVWARNDGEKLNE